MSMSTKIYQRLSRVYDLDWGKFAGQYVSLISQLFNERGITRARVLDLACGTGTLAIKLANRNHIVFGIDLSPQMIGIARSKSTGFSNVSFEVQDMTRFCVEDKFDLVSCTFDSINYLLSADALKAMFFRVSASLYDAGLFVFDSNTERLYVNRHKGRHERKLDEESFVQRLSYDPVEKEAITIFEFSDGTMEVHQQRPYDLAELKPILAKTGLHVVRTFSGFDKRPYGPESERLICVAEREASGNGV